MSKRAPLKKEELKAKLDGYRKLKNVCLEEVDNRFENVLNMLMSDVDQPNKHMAAIEAVSIREPVANIEMLIDDIKMLA